MIEISLLLLLRLLFFIIFIIMGVFFFCTKSLSGYHTPLHTHPHPHPHPHPPLLFPSLLPVPKCLLLLSGSYVRPLISMKKISYLFNYCCCVIVVVIVIVFFIFLLFFFSILFLIIIVRPSIYMRQKGDC